MLQTIQMKLILLCVRAERAVLGSAKTALKFYNILSDCHYSDVINSLLNAFRLKKNHYSLHFFLGTLIVWLSRVPQF